MRSLLAPAIILAVGAAVVSPKQALAYCQKQDTQCASGLCYAVFANTAIVVSYNVVRQYATQANCSPAGTRVILAQESLRMEGYATTAATAPVCQWQCMQGGTAPPIVRFDSDDPTFPDGLPVELLEFTVE
jgi:hypothetical protein